MIISPHFPCAAGIIIHISTFKSTVIGLGCRFSGRTATWLHIPVGVSLRIVHSAIYRLTIRIALRIVNPAIHGLTAGIIGTVGAAAVKRTVPVIIRLSVAIIPAHTTIIIPVTVRVIIPAIETAVIINRSFHGIAVAVTVISLPVEGPVIIHLVTGVGSSVIDSAIIPSEIIIIAAVSVIIIPEATSVAVISFKLAGCEIAALFSPDIRAEHTHFIIPVEGSAGSIGLPETNRIDPATIHFCIVTARTGTESVVTTITIIVDDDRGLIDDRYILPAVNIVIIDSW